MRLSPLNLVILQGAAGEESITPPPYGEPSHSGIDPREPSSSPSSDDGPSSAWERRIVYIDGEPIVLADPESAKASSRKKHLWSAEEDEKLRALIDTYGAQKWSRIADSLPGRLGKQCRERWHNHLSPDLQKAPWSAEEDRIIVDSVRQLGTKWSEMTRLLPGRTDNAIKNRWNSSQRKLQRKWKKVGLVARKLDVCPRSVDSLCKAVKRGASRTHDASERNEQQLEAEAQVFAAADQDAHPTNNPHLEAALAITALATQW